MDDTSDAYRVSYNGILGGIRSGFVLYSPESRIFQCVDLPSVGTLTTDNSDEIMGALLKLPDLITSERVSGLVAHAHSKRLKGGVALEEAVKEVERYAQEHPEYGPIQKELELYKLISDKIWSRDFVDRFLFAFETFEEQIVKKIR